jgi:hypothetical protein
MTHDQRFIVVISRRRPCPGHFAPPITTVSTLGGGSTFARVAGPSQSARFRPIGMEQVWNRGGATVGKRLGRRRCKKRLD